MKGTELNGQNIVVAAVGVEKGDVEAAAGMLHIVLHCLTASSRNFNWMLLHYSFDSAIQLFRDSFNF